MVYHSLSLIFYGILVFKWDEAIAAYYQDINNLWHLSSYFTSLWISISKAKMWHKSHFFFRWHRQKMPTPKVNNGPFSSKCICHNTTDATGSKRKQWNVRFFCPTFFSLFSSAMMLCVFDDLGVTFQHRSWSSAPVKDCKIQPFCAAKALSIYH